MDADVHRWRPNPTLRLHPGINFSKLEVGSDAGGLIFAAGTVVTMLVGLPLAVPFFFGSLVGGLVVAALIGAWRRHESPMATRPPSIDRR